jgi:hypothetical protein
VKVTSDAFDRVMFQGMVDMLQRANNEMVNDNRLGEYKCTYDGVVVTSSSRNRYQSNRWQACQLPVLFNMFPVMICVSFLCGLMAECYDCFVSLTLVS